METQLAYPGRTLAFAISQERAERQGEIQERNIATQNIHRFLNYSVRGNFPKVRIFLVTMANRTWNILSKTNCCLAKFQIFMAKLEKSWQEIKN